MIPILLLILAWLIGGIPFGYLFVKLKTGRDVRSLGSGNIGATNVMRTTGRATGMLTLLLDIAKGCAAVWLMDRFGSHAPVWLSAAALAVMAGRKANAGKSEIRLPRWFRHARAALRRVPSLVVPSRPISVGVRHDRRALAY